MISLMLVATLLLAACASPATPAPTTAAPAVTEAVKPTEAAQPTEAAAVTEAPAAATTEAPAAATTEAPAAGAATDTAVPPTPVPGGAAGTITIWHQWEGKYLDAISQVFKDYEAAHPGVKIVLDKPTDVTNSLKVAIPAGQGPDIIAWANDQIGLQALSGNIIDLNSLGVDENFLNSTYEPAAVKGVIWNGQIWGLPESQEAIALVYNKALASDADFPTDPKDFAGLMEKAKAFAEKNPGKFLVCNQGLGGKDAYHDAPVYFGFGMPSYVDDEGKVYLNTPEGLNAANWLVGFKPYAPAETSADICKSGFLDGKYAAIWTGPWNIADIEAAKIDYGILPMGSPFVGVKTFLITSNAKDRGNAETALDVMKFFTNADEEKKVALANKTIPANTAALKSPEIQALPTIAGFGGSANLGVPMSPSPFSQAQWDPVGDTTMAIWTGTQKPEEALAAGQKAIEDKVAEMK